MALIECPECKHEISNQANSCPFCGYPIKQVNEVLGVYPKQTNTEKRNKTSIILSVIAIPFALTVVLSPIGVILSVIALVSVIVKRKKINFLASIILSVIAFIISASVVIVIALGVTGVISVPQEIKEYCKDVTLYETVSFEEVKLSADNFEKYFTINSYISDYNESKNSISLYGYSLGTDYYCRCNFNVEVNLIEQMEINDVKVVFKTISVWDTISGTTSIDTVTKKFEMTIPKNGEASKVLNCSEKNIISMANNDISLYVLSASGSVTEERIDTTTLYDILFYFAEQN